LFFDNNRLFTYFDIMRETSPNTFNEIVKSTNNLTDLNKIYNKDVLADINQLTRGDIQNGRKEII
jgi:hypothetical protein